MAHNASVFTQCHPCLLVSSYKLSLSGSCQGFHLLQETVLLTALKKFQSQWSVWSVLSSEAAASRRRCRTAVTSSFLEVSCGTSGRTVCLTQMMA